MSFLALLAAATNKLNCVHVHRNYLIQLEETNVVGVVLETTTAHVQTVLSDDTMVVGTDAALS